MTSQARTITPERLRPLAACAVMTALLAALSWVAIPLPFSPVPVTLQTLAVFLAGGLLGPRWGLVAIVAYLVLGIAGVPVFAGAQAGLGILAGPRGGYLIGFVPAVVIAGFGSGLAFRLRGNIAQVAGLALALLLAAAAAVYLLGVGWLMVVAHLDVRQALVAGAVPFLPGELLKLASATILIRSLRPRLRR